METEQRLMLSYCDELLKQKLHDCSRVRLQHTEPNAGALTLTHQLKAQHTHICVCVWQGCSESLQKLSHTLIYYIWYSSESGAPYWPYLEQSWILMSFTLTLPQLSACLSLSHTHRSEFICRSWVGSAERVISVLAVCNPPETRCSPYCVLDGIQALDYNHTLHMTLLSYKPQAGVNISFCMSRCCIVSYMTDPPLQETPVGAQSCDTILKRVFVASLPTCADNFTIYTR